MKLLEPSWEIIKQEKGVEGIYKQIEKVGRTCYKSSDCITEDSYKRFVDNLIKHKHYAMLEFGTVSLKFPYSYEADYGCNHYSICRLDINGNYTVISNLRVLQELGRLDDLKLYNPTPNIDKIRPTVRFITDRAIANELVRHRTMSFAQESSRYCNYSKDKFGNELSFIEPLWVKNADTKTKKEFYNYLATVENNYMKLSKDFKAQECRDILPLCTKTEIVVTGFIEDWKHLFDLRVLDKTGKAHPEMHRLLDSLYKYFKDNYYL